MGIIRTLIKKFNNFFCESSNVTVATSASAHSAPASSTPAHPVFSYSVPAYTITAVANKEYRPSVPQGGWLAQVSRDEEESVERTVYNRNGEALALDSRLELTSGGEGIIYEYPHNNRYLIKIYKKSVFASSEKKSRFTEQMRTMINADMYEIFRKNNFLAWPQMPVYDMNRQVIGFVMKKCNGKSLGMLKNPAWISKNFPGWDRMNLAKTALDFVRKVRFLAENGIFVNDFNPENFLVDEKCNVSFIDCASFQVLAEGGKCHTTGTFFASHVAPELVLQPQKLLCPRNIHQVEFGTAIVVFNILMYGLHPYSYYDFNRNSGCADPDTNLKKGRCPLGINSDCKFPAGNWQKHWSWLTYKLKSSFIKTFRDGHQNPDARASLTELEKNLCDLICVMKQDSNYDRRSLSPAKVKKREYEGSQEKAELLFQKKY